MNNQNHRIDADDNQWCTEEELKILLENPSNFEDIKYGIQNYEGIYGLTNTFKAVENWVYDDGTIDDDWLYCYENILNHCNGDIQWYLLFLEDE